MPIVPKKRKARKAKPAKKRAKSAPKHFKFDGKNWNLDKVVASILPTDIPIRAQLLNSARDLTLGDRNKTYGDPLENFQAIAALKKAFWTAMEVSHKENDVHIDRMLTAQNTPWGHAIDMVLMNLGRIASAPTLESAMADDRYADGAAGLAIAFEIAKRLKG